MRTDIVEHNLYELYGMIAQMGPYPMKESLLFRSFSQPAMIWPDMSFVAEEVNELSPGAFGELAQLIREGGWSRTLVLGQRWLSNEVQADLRANGFLPVTQWTNMVFSLEDGELFEGRPPGADRSMEVRESPIEIREVKDRVQLSDWLRVVEKVLFNNKALPEDIFLKGLESNIFRLLSVYYGGKTAATALIFLGEVPGAYMVATDPEYRRKGLASALMDHARAMVFAKGYKELALHSTKEGLEFYLSLGFKAQDKMTLYYSRNK